MIGLPRVSSCGARPLFTSMAVRCERVFTTKSMGALEVGLPFTHDVEYFYSGYRDIIWIIDGLVNGLGNDAHFPLRRAKPIPFLYIFPQALDNLSRSGRAGIVTSLPGERGLPTRGCVSAITEILDKPCRRSDDGLVAHDEAPRDTWLSDHFLVWPP